MCGLGGITEYLKVAALAQANFIPVINHVWGSAVSIAVNLHLLTAQPDMPGGLFPSKSMLEFDTTENNIFITDLPKEDFSILDQVKNNNGTVCFDSRKVAAGIEIKTIIPKGAKPGGVAPSYAQYGTNAAQNLLYTAPTTDAFNKTYVLASGGYFSGSTVEIGGFYFNHSTRQILHHSHITINYFSIGAIPLANFGEIVIGELIS